MQWAYISCVLAIFFFSTLEFVGKLISNEISPLAITVYRFYIGSLLLAVPAWINGRKRKISLSKTDITHIAIPGIINIAVSMYLLQLAIYYGKALIAAILISSNSIFVSIFAYYILKEKISYNRLIGIIIGILGMLMIVIGNRGADYIPSKSLSLGVLFSILASVSFALFTVLAKKNIKTYGALVFNSISFFIGATVLLIIGLLLKADFTMTTSFYNLSSILYLGLIVTGLAYLLYSNALQKIPASITSSFFLLKPVFASLFAVLILKESFSVWQAFGLFLILFGLNIEQIYVLIYKIRKKYN